MAYPDLSTWKQLFVMTIQPDISAPSNEAYSRSPWRDCSHVDLIVMNNYNTYYVMVKLVSALNFDS